MKNTKAENCPFCGRKHYYQQTKKITLHYRSYPIVIQQPGYWCDKCGEGVVGGADRKATQKELQAARARIDGLLAPDEVKNIRKKLHLTQQKAAQIFGGGTNAFSRYERGETAISKPLSQLLQLLAKHPTLLTEVS